MKSFQTHTGQIVKGKKLKTALNEVANDWAELAYRIRKENSYTSHVTESTKDKELTDSLIYAESIRRGEVTNLAFLQRLNTKLTGECIGLLS